MSCENQQVVKYPENKHKAPKICVSERHPHSYEEKS